MANSYDQEFNRYTPDPVDAPEVAPYSDVPAGSKKAFSAAKLLALIASVGAAIAMLILSSYSVDNIEPRSAELNYDIEITEGSEDEEIPEFKYELKKSGELVDSGILDPEQNSKKFNGLEPDTRYTLYIWRDDRLVRAIRFRTPPLPLEDRPAEQSGGPGPGFAGGIGGEGPEPEPSKAPEPSATPSPMPSATPSPSPSPSPTPTPTPSPSPAPAPAPAPYVPPVIPDPIPATPEPTPTPPPYYDPEPSTTTDPRYVIRGIEAEAGLESGVVNVKIHPNINTDDYRITRIGMTLLRGNTSYGSSEYNAPSGMDEGLTGSFALQSDHGGMQPGTYTLAVDVTFEGKSVTVADSAFRIEEFITVYPEPPLVSLSLADSDWDSDGKISYTVNVQQNDYIVDDLQAYVDCSDPLCPYQYFPLTLVSGTPGLSGDLVYEGTLSIAEVEHHYLNRFINIRAYYGSDYMSDFAMLPPIPKAEL